MDWQECCERRIVKRVSEDEELITSFIKTSRNKLESEGKLEMSEVTAVSKLSLAYDSLREMLESFSLKNGFKIYNHECYTAFLKEIMKVNELGEEFDEIRKIRNDVNYYGKEISIEDVKELILRIKKLRLRILDLLNL